MNRLLRSTILAAVVLLGRTAAAEDCQALSRPIAVGECHEKANKHASAWKAYTQALASEEDAERIAFAKERLAALEAKVHRVVVSVEDAPDASATIDDQPVSLGTPVPLDPEDHVEVLVVAPGKKPWSQTLTLPSVPGDTHLTARLEDAPPRVVVPPSPPARQRSSTIPLLVGGTGIAVAGLGTALLFVAQGQGDDAVARAEAANAVRDPDAYARAQDARDSAVGLHTLGIGVIAVGVIAVGTAAYLLFSRGTAR